MSEQVLREQQTLLYFLLYLRRFVLLKASVFPRNLSASFCRVELYKVSLFLKCSLLLNFTSNSLILIMNYRPPLNFLCSTESPIFTEVVFHFVPTLDSKLWLKFDMVCVFLFFSFIGRGFYKVWNGLGFWKSSEQSCFLILGSNYG